MPKGIASYPKSREPMQRLASPSLAVLQYGATLAAIPPAGPGAAPEAITVILEEQSWHACVQ